MVKQFENASPDAAIQDQQRMRAKGLKRLGIVVGTLLIAAIAVVIFITLPNAEKDFENTPEVPVSFEGSVEQDAAREAFKQTLSAFEEQIAPQLSKIADQKWKSERLKSFEEEKERALALFANAGFMQALGTLNALKAESESFIDEWDKAYIEKLEHAQDFYANQQIQQARLALAQADKIKSDDPKSETLRRQLAAYERVERYLQQLAVARVENDLEKQVALMQQVIEADPTRIDINAPLETALAKLKQSRLALALKKAQEALSTGDISEAKTYLEQAEIIKATAKGITALRTQLNARLAEQSLGAIKAELKSLQNSDAWTQVLSLAERGLQRFSQDADLLQSRTQAASILSAQRNFERFIARPDRLADSSIRDAAQSAIQQSISLLSSSRNLAATAQTLAGLIDNYAVQVEVTVVSDGKTDISVIGTGVVGKTEQKVITLSPGRYTFEGKREGYRSKRKEVVVNSNSPLQVYLVCDEKIN